MKAYEFDDYRSFLIKTIEAKKKNGFPISYSKLADEIRVQRSYLTHVFKERAQLSSDQLFLLCNALHVSTPEIEYLETLLEIERCGISGRRGVLEKKRDRIKKKHFKSQSYLESKDNEVASKISGKDEALVEYFGDPLCPVVHMLFSMSKYRKKPQMIAERLQLDKDSYRRILSVLEKAGFIEYGKNGVSVKSRSIHLDEESYLSRLRAMAFRLKAIEYQRLRNNSEDYFFTATFATNEAIRKEIQERFMKLLSWFSQRVKKEQSEDVYQMNFDLFRYQ